MWIVYVEWKWKGLGYPAAYCGVLQWERKPSLFSLAGVVFKKFLCQYPLSNPILPPLGGAI